MVGTCGRRTKQVFKYLSPFIYSLTLFFCVHSLPNRLSQRLSALENSTSSALARRNANTVQRPSASSQSRVESRIQSDRRTSSRLMASKPIEVEESDQYPLPSDDSAIGTSILLVFSHVLIRTTTLETHLPLVDGIQHILIQCFPTHLCFFSNCHL